MSDHTNVSGEFIIEPPLTWAEYRGNEFAPHNLYSYHPDLVLRVDEKEVDTEEGTLTRRTATALEVRELYPYNPRNLLEYVQRAVDAFPGHTFTGRLDCEGDEAGDPLRIVIRNGKAIRVDVKLIWPDEDVES
jgi:hypothetical protein